MLYMNMKDVLTRNLINYCSKEGLNSVSLGEKTGISQRTSHRLLSDNADQRNPTIASIEAVSESLSIPYWQLFMKDFPVGLMGDDSVETIIRMFLNCSPNARTKIMQNISDIARLDALDRGKEE